MNTERYINNETTIAVAIVATISVLFAAPAALASPVFALGHWHEGDNNMKSSAYNSGTQKELVSCLVDTQEGSIPTQDEVEDCLNTAGSSEERIDIEDINQSDEDDE